MRHSPESILSVIVPTYNRSGYVRQCLRSSAPAGVRRPGNHRRRRRLHGRHRAGRRRNRRREAMYFRQANTGTPATARNRGFEMSRGRYVAFLDCDDEWLPDAPARAVELLDRHPEVDVLFAEARMGNPAEGYRSWIEMGGQDAFFDLPCRQPEAGLPHSGARAVLPPHGRAQPGIHRGRRDAPRGLRPLRRLRPAAPRRRRLGIVAAHGRRR